MNEFKNAVLLKQKKLGGTFGKICFDNIHNKYRLNLIRNVKDKKILPVKLPLINTSIQFGKIYTFQYLTPKTRNILDYGDVYPMSFVLKIFKSESTKNVIFEGINLNFLPQKIRIEILNAFKNFMQSQYDKDKTKQERSIIFTGKDWPLFVDTIVAKLQFTNYQFAIRRYIVDSSKYMKNLVQVSQDDGIDICLQDELIILGNKKMRIEQIYYLFGEDYRKRKKTKKPDRVFYNTKPKLK